MKIVEVKHPLVKHKLGLMRENDISTKRFRELASEVGSLLTYEATADRKRKKSPSKAGMARWKSTRSKVKNYRCADSARGVGHDGRRSGKCTERAYQRSRDVP